MKSLVDKYVRFNPRTGFPEPIWWKRACLPYQLTFDPQYVTGALTVPATGTAVSVFKEGHTSNGLDQGYGTPMLIKESTFEDSTDTTAAAQFTVFLKDMGDMTQFMNQPIHIRNFAGTSQLAAKMSEPLFLPTLHAIQATYAKISGGAVSMRHFLNGILMMPWSTMLMSHEQDRQMMFKVLNVLTNRRKQIFPFWLTTDQVVTIPANGTFEVDTDIGTDGCFEATHIVGVSTGNYNINILNPDTKQSITNGQMSSGSAIGTAQNPQDLPATWLIPPGKRLRFQFTDTSGSTNRVDICLRGRRIRADIKMPDDPAKLAKAVNEVKNDLRIPKAMGV